mmetsp:Transcript_1741/g.5033  ORF Transcript_1741/g.5033 Transcript_1741/m.5033 type:complete len:554 (-) Transcript_1741:202-1863(-)|eukprot:CAMPEP_0206146008 /NCGR_PEP_ID=MMETSP1473-20131121/29233_1 /ASSEMBLY_ACC=CAM_ASM_001109 /TAXON_ID=1461547 /ORGANISM="Stichococcus sp, Strain RCC1054" /LENGTH=553 /DNA_ID=CAMNT_0053542429 /DNA_START=109 /DNA_END=1770 /DNA_ORIENTATION=+
MDDPGIAAIRCSLAGIQLRNFRNGLQGLGKIGAELLIEALPDQIVLRTINSSRSACMSATYAFDFFEDYQLQLPLDSQGEQQHSLQSAVLMKQMAAIFRTQRVNRMSFVLTAEVLSSVVDCENGLRKTYRVPCTDTEVVGAAVDRDSLAIRVIADADELNRLLSSFQATLSEMSIIAQPETGGGRDVRLVSYVDPAKGHSDKQLHTELDLSSDLFLDFANRGGTPSDATFNVRDLKAMVALCEAMHAHVAISFDSPGQPLVVAPHPTGNDGQENFFQAELVLATLMESQAGLYTESPAPARRETARRTTEPPSTGHIRTPAALMGGTPGPYVTAGRHANGSGAAAQPAATAQVGSGSAAVASGERSGPSRMAPTTARRDLNSALRQAREETPGSGPRDWGRDDFAAMGDGRDGNGITIPSPAAASPAHAEPEPSFAFAAASVPDNQPAQRAPQNTGGTQQYHLRRDQQQWQQAGAAPMQGGAASDDDDQGLDNYASLPPDGGAPFSSRQLPVGIHLQNGSGGLLEDVVQAPEGYDVLDDTEDPDEAVPGTPPA